MLRTPWPVVLINVAPFFALLLVPVTFDVIFDQSPLWALVRLSAGCGALALVHRHLLRTVLTPDGVVLRWFRSRLVPWNHIGGVGRYSFLGSDHITVWVLTENKTRRLPAPRRDFGIGSGAVAAAQALVEQWWIEHRGPAPAVNPAVRTPRAGAGR